MLTVKVKNFAHFVNLCTVCLDCSVAMSEILSEFCPKSITIRQLSLEITASKIVAKLLFNLMKN